MKSKSLSLFFACVAATCGLAIRSGAALPPEPPAELKSQLLRYRESYIRGMLEGKAELLEARGSNDSRLITEAQPTVLGASAIAAYHRAFLDRFIVQAYTREPTGQFDLGSRTLETGRFAQTLILKSTRETFDLTGKYLELWDKLPAGELRHVVSATNFDAFFARTDLLRFSEIPSIRTAFQARTPITSDRILELSGLGLLLERAVTERAAALWKRLYSDDAVLLANNSPICTGRVAIDEYVDTHCRELPVFQKLDIRNDRIEELDGYVFEYASHVASWRNGDSSGVSTGKNLRIWRRESGQTLKMIFQVGAYD